MKKDRLILVAIVFLALFLRLFRLSDVPPGVNRDEASIGYTAYSFLQTGRDEYGRSWPISFQSFGDWKLPLYIYTTVPFVATMGLNELAVRLPSVIAGIVTVVVTYFLTYELFSREAGSRSARRLSLISSTLLAISPWHLHLSRVESESNIAVAFTATGFLLLLKSFRRPFLALPGAILLALTYYTYHGSHITTTLLMLGFLVIFWRQTSKSKFFQHASILFLVLVGFILYYTLLGADKTKLSGIGVWGDPFVVHERIELPRSDHASAFIGALIHNRVTFTVETVAKNYIKSFSPEFLFISGGTNRAHNIPNFGNMYLIEAPFLLLGLFVCLINRKKSAYQFILLWILLSPIAASITKDAPHTNRMFAIFPALPIVVAMGVEFIRRKRFALMLITLLYALNISVYLDRYYVHFPKSEVAAWGQGYKMLRAFVDQEKYASKTVVMANPETSPYIFLIFYGKDDASLFQKKVERYEPTPDGFYHVRVFGRYEFRAINWDRDIFRPNSLLVDYPERIPKDYQPRMLRVAQFGIVPSYL